MSKVEARKRMQSLALHQRLNANNVSEIFKCIDENKPPSPELSFRLMYVKGNTKSPPHCEFEVGIWVLVAENERIPSKLKNRLINLPFCSTTWDLSSGPPKKRSGFRIRYCYPSGGRPEFSEGKGSTLWTRYSKDGKEDPTFRLLHVYISPKRSVASKKSINGMTKKSDKQKSSLPLKIARSEAKTQTLQFHVPPHYQHRPDRMLNPISRPQWGHLHCPLRPGQASSTIGAEPSHSPHNTSSHQMLPNKANARPAGSQPLYSGDFSADQQKSYFHLRPGQASSTIGAEPSHSQHNTSSHPILPNKAKARPAGSQPLYPGVFSADQQKSYHHLRPGQASLTIGAEPSHSRYNMSSHPMLPNKANARPAGSQPLYSGDFSADQQKRPQPCKKGEDYVLGVLRRLEQQHAIALQEATSESNKEGGQKVLQNWAMGIADDPLILFRKHGNGANKKNSSQNV